MFATGLSDLDELVLRCRNPKARSYIAEAIACLKAGAFRASIVVTWVSVVHDLLAKLEQIALAGDKNAQIKVDEFHRIVEAGDLKSSLAFEREILNVARKEFEFIGALAHADLERLREDRHRCAHPSMIDPDTDYRPTHELARCHIVNAVIHLLGLAPAQGKAALERLTREMDQVCYPEDVNEIIVHLEDGPLANPRESLVRNFITILLKKYISESSDLPSSPLDAIRYRRNRAKADRRVVGTLEAVVRMHPKLALGAVSERLTGIVDLAPETRFGALVVLVSRVSGAWNALSKAQKNRLQRYVRAMPKADIQTSLRAAWEFSETQPGAREFILRGSHWTVLADIPDPPDEWAGLAVDYLSKADSWGKANSTQAFLVRNAHLLTRKQVTDLLPSTSQEDDLRTSFALNDLLHALSLERRFGPKRVKDMIMKAGLGGTFSKQHWWP